MLCKNNHFIECESKDKNFVNIEGKKKKIKKEDEK